MAATTGNDPAIITEQMTIHRWAFRVVFACKWLSFDWVILFTDAFAI
jgi:hypothetical protein